jgi:N-acetylmuramic acid 6-phosphate (MurNAc-6-P) etherase
MEEKGMKRMTPAITMILAGCDVNEAQQRLEQANGHVREAIK